MPYDMTGCLLNGTNQSWFFLWNRLYVYYISSMQNIIFVNHAFVYCIISSHGNHSVYNETKFCDYLSLFINGFRHFIGSDHFIENDHRNSERSWGITPWQLLGDFFVLGFSESISIGTTNATNEVDGIYSYTLHPMWYVIQLFSFLWLYVTSYFYMFLPNLSMYAQRLRHWHRCNLITVVDIVCNNVDKINP